MVHKVVFSTTFYGSRVQHLEIGITHKDLENRKNAELVGRAVSIAKEHSE